MSGEFRLVREIGRGGMGVVYEALDEQLDRWVAIKTLPPHLAADPAVRSRFLREARTAGSLSHPNIVPIYRGAERDGTVYFVMGLVRGESLAERVARGPLETARLLPIVRQLAVALDHAHAHGVVHRDIKAENVLLDERDHVMVTDFGIARVAEAQPMTATGTVLGTVHYMSPEQVQGDDLDGRSDLYALGVLMFYALAGRFPFERATAPAVLVAHVTSAPPRLSDVVPGIDAGVEAIVTRLLAKAPAARYASAKDLLDAVTSVMSRPAVPHRVAVPGSDRMADVEPGPLAMRMASADAQQVWARAAELQANTGAMPRPAAFAAPAELLTRGYDAADVRAAAVDAGIDEQYVTRALVERDAAALAVHRGAAMATRPNPVLGEATKLEFSLVLDRELRSEDFEELADEMRSAIGQVVNVSAVGRTLSVNTVASSPQGGIPRYLQVTLSSRNGRTHIRAFEDLSQTAGGLFGGIGAGAGIGGGAVLAALIGNATHSPPGVIAALLASMGVAVGGARWLFMRSSRKKQQQLETLVRRLGEKVLSLPPGP